jgi:hypothetical protein
MLGAWIEHHLMPTGADEELPLWSLLAGTASAAGLDPAGIPDAQAMLRQVAGTLGTLEFGTLKIPAAHQPRFPPIELLARFWHPARRVLRLTLPEDVDVPEPAVDEAHWPVLVSVVAARLLVRGMGLLPAEVAFRVVMEAALICAKVDPAVIAPGAWRIEAAGGELFVGRGHG